MNASHFWIALDHWGFSAARVLLTVLWQSSILFLATMLLARLLRRRRATLRHALWVAALLAAPLLPLLTLAGSHLGAPRAPVSVLPTYVEPVELPALPMAPLPPAPSAEAPAPTVVAPEPAPPTPSFSLWDYPWALLLVGYASGVACFLALTVLGRARLRQWVLGAAPVLEKRTQLAFAGAGKRLGLRQEVRLLESARVPVPLTTGAFRPVVLLPGGLCARLSDAELCSLALHESAHIHRRDPLTLSVIPLVRALLFFHPLVWLACRQVSLLAEQAADDAVLEVTGEPVAYAKMLARVAEELRRRSLTTELAAGIVLSKSAFLRRVEAILSDRRDSLRRLSRRALALTILAVLLSLFLASALPLTEKGSGATERETTPGGGEPESATKFNMERIFETIRQREARVKTLKYVWASKELIPKGSMTVAGPATRAPIPSDLAREDTEIEGTYSILMDGAMVRVEDRGPRRTYTTLMGGAMVGAEDRGPTWFARYATMRSVPGTEETLVLGADGVERQLFRYADGHTSGVVAPLRYITSGIAYQAVLQAYRLTDSVLGKVGPREVSFVGRAELQGHPCIVIEKEYKLPDSSWVHRWWLAEDMGYSVLRWEDKRESGEPIVQLDMEYTPDQQIGWRLISWSLTIWEGTPGQPLLRGNVATEVHINEPVAAATFQITFPPGTRVSDRLGGGLYVVGEQPETYPAGPLEGDMPFEERVVRVKLKWRLPFHFTDAPLAYLLNLIRAVVGIDFVLDPQLQAEQDKLKVTMSMKDSSTEDALDSIATALNLQWSVRDGSVHISPKKPEPSPAAVRGGPAPPTASDPTVSAPLGEKELGFDEIAQGINASRSTLRSMRVRYEVSYRGTNWGLMEGEDGRQVSRDQYAGSHELAVNNISNDSLWHQEKLRWYLRCPLPSYGPEAEQVTAFDGEYQWCLYQPKSRRPLGTVSAKVNDSWFAWNSRIFDIACLVYHDTWEHALKTGTLVLERKEAIDGHQCYVLEGRVCVLPDTGFAGYPVKVWIDPARGFAVVRLEVYSRTNGELETFSSYDVLEMKKGAPNLWVPVHVLFRHDKEIVVKDITVNERLPDDLFTIKFPDGTRVQDDRRDRSYTVVDVPTPAEPRQKAEIGGPAPELVLEQGAAVKLAQSKGMPVVLAFVSIYARPCVKVLDDLKALQEKQGVDKLGVIAVHDRTATPEEIEQFRKDHSIPFPILRVKESETAWSFSVGVYASGVPLFSLPLPPDALGGWDSATFRAYGVTALPRVVLIDGQGKVASIGDGSSIPKGVPELLGE